MNPQNTTILFSHGFGIRKDNLGLFTFLAEEFKLLGFPTVMFDYYKYDEETKEIYTVPFSKQAEILHTQIKNIKDEFPNNEIVIVAQSQGSIVPALCDISDVAKVFAISPFFLTDKEAVYARYSARAGSTTDFNKTSRRKHSDGTTTIIPPEYWTERFHTNQYDLYNNLGLKTSLTMIYGTNDSLVKSAEVEKIKNAKRRITDADHDFTGENREILNKILQEELI